MPTSPARTRVILAELRELCMSPCTMTNADRREHSRLVARQRARDEAKRQGSPQMMLGGV